MLMLWLQNGHDYLPRSKGFETVHDALQLLDRRAEFRRAEFVYERHDHLFATCSKDDGSQVLEFVNGRWVLACRFAERVKAVAWCKQLFVATEQGVWGHVQGRWECLVFCDDPQLAVLKDRLVVVGSHGLQMVKYVLVHGEIVDTSELDTYCSGLLVATREQVLKVNHDSDHDKVEIETIDGRPQVRDDVRRPISVHGSYMVEGSDVYLFGSDCLPAFEPLKSSSSWCRCHKYDARNDTWSSEAVVMVSGQAGAARQAGAS
jgi:hypothetical protein